MSTPTPSRARGPALRGAASNLVAAVVTGAFQVLLAVSLAALVWSGNLAPYVARGIGFTLVGSCAVAVAVALLSTLPGTFGGSQNSTGAILAIVASQVAAAAGAAAGAAPEAAFASAVVAIGVTGFATGLFLLALGRFRLGKLVRFLPFPIMGGYLAGTGWLLAVGALGMMTGVTPAWSSLPGLFAPDVLARWLPGLLLAVVMLATVERARHTLALPGVLVAAVALFHVAAWATGTPIADLSAGGWLLGPFPTGDLWRPLTASELATVDVSAIVAQLPAMATLLPVTAVGVLLGAGALELVRQQEGSLDRELAAAGTANLLAGALGGLVGFQQVGVSTLGSRLGVESRSVALAAAATLAVTLFTGASLLSLVPRFVLGAMLLYIGLGFLKEWIVSAWFHLPRLEYAVVVTIVIVIAAVGFLEGVAVGIVAAVVLFVVMYSRVQVVRHELTGAQASSRVSRNAHQRRVLAEHASRLRVLHLQGFIFFGTGEMLLRRVRERIEEEADALPGPRSLILDFRRVTGLDSTATRSFLRMRRLAASHGVRLVLTAVPDPVRHALTARGLDADETVRFVTDLDSGLETCENELLREAAEPAAPGGPLAALLPGEPGWRDLAPYLRRQVVARGERLIRQGDAPDRMFFVEDGTLTAQLERPGDTPLRLETMGGGSVLGEMGFFLDQVRSASVVADEESVVHRLDREALERMQRDEPALALALHRLVVRLLSERVGHLMGVVQALER